jgi:hypothetical protein
VDSPFVYSGPLNLNTELTSFPNGAVVTIKEPSVSAARAHHISYYGSVLAAAEPIAVTAPLVAAAPAAVRAPIVYSGRLNLNT